MTYPPLAKDGRLRILATYGNHRVASLPGVPTLDEMGLHNSEAGLWHGVVGPPGLPKAIRDKIGDDVREVLAVPEVKCNSMSGATGRP